MRKPLTGTVRDASGAVLPGVTVEAASPALIEKTRTAVTDGTGQYRIIDLRPGIYSLTFTLTGFTTVKRENIEFAGSQIVTIPIEMRVGALAETITVTGETPVVDVQSAKREVVLNNEMIQALPAARAAGALLNATPGLMVDTNGPALSPTMTFFNAHSSTANSNVGRRRRAHDGQRDDDRGGEERRRLVLRLRHAELAGSGDHRRRRAWGKRHRRPGDEHGAEVGRQ